MSTDNKHSRKCPNCGKWSEWNMDVTGRCQFCGELMDPAGFKMKAEKAAWEEKNSKQFKVGLIEIYPHDSKITVFFKKIIQALQISFMAVISFILWLIAMVAG